MNEKLEKVLNSTLEVLDLSTLESNAMRRANILSIRDLLGKCEEDLKKTRNFGKKSLDSVLFKLKSFLKDNGYNLYDFRDEYDDRYFTFKEYEDYKLEQNQKENGRKKLLNTPLYKLGIHCSNYFEDLSYLPKTLGDLLIYLSDNSNLSKVKNKEELNKLILELRIPNIYFGMSEEEIKNLVVSDDMLVLLDEVINNVALRQQIKNNEDTIVNTKQMREERLGLETKSKESFGKVVEENENAIALIKEGITEDKKRLETKKSLMLELQKLTEEKLKLMEMNDQLDAEINQLMVRMYGVGEYAKRK